MTQSRTCEEAQDFRSLTYLMSDLESQNRTYICCGNRYMFVDGFDADERPNWLVLVSTPDGVFKIGSGTDFEAALKHLTH